MQDFICVLKYSVYICQKLLQMKILNNNFFFFWYYYFGS